MSIRVLIRQKRDREHLLLYYVDPLTNKEVSRTAGTGDRREAERSAARWEAELEAHRGADGTSWRWFRDRFNTEYLGAMPPNSRRVYRTAMNHFERLMRVSSVKDVTASTISTFQAKLREEGKRDTSISTYLSHFRVAMNWAADVAEMIPKAPHFVMPKLGKRKMMKGRPITLAEHKAMLAAVREVRPTDAARWERFLWLLWYSGLRLGEARLLSWDSAPIRVAVDAKPYPHVLFWAEGHKSREDQATPLPRDFHASLLKTPKGKRRGPVAPLLSRTGRQLPLLKVSRIISKIGKQAGVVVDEETGKFASAHDYRRAFGSRWAQALRPVTLQRLMRHANIATTLKYYVHLSAVDAGAELWGVESVPTNVPKEAVDAAMADARTRKKRGKIA